MDNIKHSKEWLIRNYWGDYLRILVEFSLSLIFILGWFILIAGIIGFIVSLIAKGIYIVVPSLAIIVGLLFIWSYKKFCRW
jgi:hypothetical protein